MKQETIGIDRSLNSPSTTVTIDEVSANCTNPQIAFTTESSPELPILARPENMAVVCEVVNGIVTPNLQILLASVLTTIDASIANKEQNKAVKHILRTQFDHANMDILVRSYPDCNFASGPSYMLEPNPNAFSCGTIRK